MKRAAKISLIAITALGAVLLAGALWLESHFGGELPELAVGLPPQFIEADVEFKKRIEARFPIGMPEQELVDMLRGQGFSIHMDKKIAQFEQPGLVCRLVWQVFWKTEQPGSISGVGGAYWGACL